MFTVQECSFLFMKYHHKEAKLETSHHEGELLQGWVESNSIHYIW